MIQGVERFLSDDPQSLIKKGAAHQVPLMIGVTKDEFGYKATGRLNFIQVF